MTANEFLKTFNINADTADIVFQDVDVQPYNFRSDHNQFGEKKSVLYRTNLTIFNTNVLLRVLAFNYENHAEVLKLEIHIFNEHFSNEIAPCKNFLQRKRNLNLTFNVLLNFAKLFEMRRLICLSIFQKQMNVAIQNTDTGINVTCYKRNSSVKYLELSWNIMWKVDDLEISDFIEFYLNYKTLERNIGDQIKEKLADLVNPHLDFHKKLKLWRVVMDLLYNNDDDVLEISDSEDESVVIVDKNVCEKEECMIID